MEFGRVGAIISVERADGSIMVGKKNIGRFSGVCLAIVGVGLVAAALQGFLRTLNFALAVLIVVGLGVGFYVAGVWATTDRRDELDRKFPISSNELRKRGKSFYDWLASQGRR